jgi:tetratricopeptide (TPR) repeat protein
MKRAAAIIVILMGAWNAWAETTGASQGEDCFRRGYLFAMSREWEQAIEWYSKAIELNPKNAEVYFQRAITYEMTGKTLSAIEDYETAVKLKPASYLAMEYLAKLYESEGRYDKAVDLYTRALPLVQDPKWRSIVKWWIAEAKKKGEAGKQNADRRSR